MEVMVVKVTVHDVAKEAGVSTATVSRVVNKIGTVSEENKQKVLKAIEDTGYVPNSIARSLKMQATFTVGFVISDISNKYFMSVAKAIEEVVSQENYNMIVASTNGKGDKERAYLEMLLSKNMDGLIINSSGENDEYIAELSKRIPIILLHRKLSTTHFLGDLIDSNNIHGGYQLAIKLLEKGHRRIGIINGPMNLSTSRERLLGIRKAFTEYHMEIDDQYLLFGDFTKTSGYDRVKDLLTLQVPPTAIIFCNNDMALGALKYLRKTSIKIPEDLSLVVYGNIDNNDLLFIKLTSVIQDPWIIGNKAGAMLLERIQRKIIQNREIIFDTNLSDGTSIIDIE